MEQRNVQDLYHRSSKPVVGPTGMFKFIIVAILCLYICGCFPAKYYMTPSVSGRVVDLETKEPIADAVIHFKKYTNKKVFSNNNGEFDLHEIVEWEYVILLGAHDRIAPASILIVEADGYETNEHEIGHDMTYIIKSELKKKDKSQNRSIKGGGRE